METIGIPVREFFLRALLQEAIEAQDQAEKLERSQSFDAELTDLFREAHAKLFAARVRIQQQLDEVTS